MVDVRPPTWTETRFGDSTADSSSKSYTIANGVVWHLHTVQVDYTADATVGNRRLALRIINGSTVDLTIESPLTQAASTTRYYTFGLALPSSEVFVNSRCNIGLPVIFLGQAEILRVVDINAVAPTTDDMIVRIRTGVIS